MPILLRLCDDPRVEVRLNVATGLSWGGRPDAVHALFLLCRDEAKEVAECARTALDAYGSSPGELQPELLKILRLGALPERRLAARRLAQCGLPAHCELEVLAALSDPDLELVRALLEGVANCTYVSPDYRKAVVRLLREDGPLTLPAARVLARIDRAHPTWKRLLRHESEEVALLAAESIGRSQLGLGNKQFLELPSAVLARLLENLHPTVIRPEILIAMLKRSELGARLAAIMALRYLPEHSPRVLKALQRHLCDPNEVVAVTSARVLLQLGHGQHAWALLRSPELRDQEVALGWIRQNGLPAMLGREYAAGRVYNAAVFGALREALTAKRVAKLAAQATLLLAPSGRADWAHLSDLGAPALPILAELLRHESKKVREVAMQAMAEIVWAQSPASQSWLAAHADSLVLDPEDCESLFLALLESFDGAEALGSRVWLAVSRSEVASTAVQGLEALARGLERNSDFAQGLLDGLQHFEPSVRRHALQWIAQKLPWQRWRPRGQSLEARLLLVSRLFYEGPVEPLVLQKAVELMSQFALVGGGLLVPTSPSQLLMLLELMGSSEVYDAVARRLVFRYAGDTTRIVWRALLKVSGGYPELVERWPRLVLTWLRRGEQVGAMGTAAAAGIRLALGYHQPALRKLALESLFCKRRFWKKLLAVELKRIQERDPDEDVRSLAVLL